MIEFTQLEFLISRRIEYLYYEISAEETVQFFPWKVLSMPGLAEGLYFDLLDFNDFLDSPDCLADL